MNNQRYCEWCKQWQQLAWFYHSRMCLPCQVKLPHRNFMWWHDVATVARERGVPSVPTERPVRRRKFVPGVYSYEG